MPLRLACLTVILLLLPYGSGSAVQQVKSLYTAVDLAACKTAGRDGRGDARLCEGLPGYPVYVVVGERGTYLSVGKEAERRQAAGQTLNSFNTLFEKGGHRTTVEWRFVVRDAQTVPYATIVRYFTHDATGAGEVLVVTRVTDREACHVAWIDALANVDAIVLARKLADTDARSKPCPETPSIQGAAGRSPM